MQQKCDVAQALHLWTPQPHSMKPWAAYLLLSATAGVAWSQFEVELNGMRIREPASMVNEYQVAMGDFGEDVWHDNIT